MPYYLITWKDVDSKEHSIIRNSKTYCINEVMFLSNSKYATDVEYTLVTENW